MNQLILTLLSLYFRKLIHSKSGDLGSLQNQGKTEKTFRQFFVLFLAEFDMCLRYL